MVQGFVEGQPYDQIVKEMEKELGVERWKIERLVRTEGAFISNQAQLSAYYKSGIEKYQYLARVDQRTSEICKELNGKVFEVQKAQAGENFPPMHPYCRSVTKAYFGDKSNETEEERLGKENLYELSEQDKQDIINGKYPNGIKIDSFSDHFYEREEERKVSPEDIKSALKNPLKITEIKPDKYGGSYKVISETAINVINSTTNNLITVHRTHSKLIKKLKKIKN